MTLNHPKKGYICSNPLGLDTAKSNATSRTSYTDRSMMEEVKHQGYTNVGGNSLTERFNTNNTEMNRRRFYEDNA